MKRLILLAFLLLTIGGAARAQTPIQLGPYSSATQAYVCSFPEAGNPCANQATIYSDAALMNALDQPLSLAPNTPLIFYVTDGASYRVQLVGAISAQFLIYGGGAGGGSGTVTSVAMTVPSWLSVAGSPIHTTGTLAVTAASAQTSHRVIGTCGTLTSFQPCALVAGDLPTTTVNSVVNDTNVTGSISAQALTLGWTGTLAVSRGGSGVATITGIIKGAGTSAFSAANSADVDLLFTGAGKCYLFKGTTPGTNDGCDVPTGAGTVTVSGGGNLTSGAFMTGAGTQVSQTPSATSTLDASGNAVFAGTVSATGIIAGTAPSGCTSSISGGECFTEAASTGFTPTSGQDYIRADSTLHKMVINNGTGGELVAAQTVASGTAAMGTSAISSGACATVVTVSATGVATTDVVSTSFNGDPTAVTGYGASATGAVLTIYPYPTSGNVNFKVCNSSANSITPSALTLNWKVSR